LILIIFDIISNGLVGANKTLVTDAPAEAEANTAAAAKTTKAGNSNETEKKPIDFEKSRQEIIENIKNQFKALKNLSDEFRSIFKNETDIASTAYKNFTDNIAWYFKPPTENETIEVDKELAEYFPFGGDEQYYVDTIDKLTVYCNKSDSRLEKFKSWYRRKYRYNVVVQVTLNLIIARIEDKTEYYCNSTAHKEDYIKNINKIKGINDQLKPIWHKLVDIEANIQNSTSKIPKVGQLCCAFWEFKRTLANTVKSSEAVDFAVDMMVYYFRPATKYVCFMYPNNSEMCKEEEKAEKPPKAKTNYKSLILQFIWTLGEIVSF